MEFTVGSDDAYIIFEKASQRRIRLLDKPDIARKYDVINFFVLNIDWIIFIFGKIINLEMSGCLGYIIVVIVRGGSELRLLL